MFGKKEKCAICGKGLSGNKIQINDGFICPVCNRLSTGSPLCTVEQLKRAWEENHRRFQAFKPGLTIANFGSGFLFIDSKQQMIYLSNNKNPKLEPIVFKFFEIDEFRIKQVGQKTITKTKGGIRRAIAGGALFGVAGAIVGASTAKQETKQVGGIPILYVDLNINDLKTTVSIAWPPLKAANYLESAMNQQTPYRTGGPDK